MSLSEPGFLTVAEVADLLRVSRMEVYRMVHAGSLPGIRFGHLLRVPRTAVESVMREQMAEAAPTS